MPDRQRRRLAAPETARSTLALMLSQWPLRRMTFAVLLLLPVALLYRAHFHPRDARLVPTGFVQYDQPYYMANARQYLDGATDGLRYALPFSPSADARPIHFQPQTFLLAGLWRITGADPGHLFVAFGFAMAWLCVLLGLRLLDVVAGLEASPVLCVLFIWGGGLLALAGFGYGLAHGMDARQAALGAFRFDPGNGWWFMNLGRNLVFPLEAYYHALFFGMVLLLFAKRLWWGILLGVLLALSHPFTGSAALLILLGWGAWERIARNGMGLSMPWLLCAVLALGALLAWHGVVLPADAEHASVMKQWRLPWLVEAESALPAYAIVGLMVAWRLRSTGRLNEFFSEARNRLLVVWAMVFLVLENHDLVMEPIQPAHFTRGYAWTALFLIGAPGLHEAWRVLRGARVRWLVAPGFVALLLLDNTAWFALRAAENRNGAGEGIWMTAEQVELYRWLEQESLADELLVAEEPLVAYLAMTYTQHRAWYSHFANTPEAERRLDLQRAYFAGTRMDDALHGEHLAIVLGNRPHPFPAASRRVYANAAFTVYRVNEGNGPPQASR